MGDETGHGLNQGFDREWLAQHRGSTEPVGLFGRLFVPRAQNDRRRWVPLLDATDQGSGESALVSVELDEIGNDEVGRRARRSALQPVDQQQFVALIAKHLANKVSSGAVVVDDQDLSHSRHGGGFAPEPQF